MSFKKVDNTEVALNKNYQSTSVAPTEKKKQTYIGKIVLGVLHSFIAPIKIMGLWLAQKFYEFQGDQEKAAKIKFQITHLEIDIGEVDNFLDYKKKLLVTARNIVDLKLFEDETMKQEIIDSILVDNKKTDFGKAVQQLRSEVKKGVCAGACLDFAEKISEKITNTGSLNSTDILEIAEEFESGVGIAGVVAQYKYSLNTQTGVIGSLIEQSLDDLQKHNKLTDLEASLVIDSLLYGVIPDGSNPDDKKVSKMFTQLREDNSRRINANSRTLTELFGDQLPPYRALNYMIKDLIKSKKFNEQAVKDVVEFIITNYKIDDPKQQDVLRNVALYVGQYAVALQQRFTDLSTRITIAQTPLKTREKIAKVFNEKIVQLVAIFSQTCAEKMMKHKVVNLPELQIGSRIEAGHKEKMLNSRGLKLNILNIKGLKNDREILAGLKDTIVEPGVYDITFDTSDRGAHATLLMKTNEGEFFFWDPNIGLIQCKDNPRKILKKVLSNYSTPSNSPGNHHISIRQFV